MTARLLDGKSLAQKIRKQLCEQIVQRASKGLSAPGLAVILVGHDPASEIYVRNKRIACEEVGMRSFAFDLPDTVSQMDLLKLIHDLNKNSSIHGILLQLPLPKQINSAVVLEAIAPEKDVDGFHAYNLGRLVQFRPALRPCTPMGIMQLLAHAEIPLAGLNAVVVGASNIVGKPMALELLAAKCTVTVCHSATKNLEDHIKQADLLVSAIGNPKIIDAQWLKPNSIAIDVGMNRLADGSLVGDIDFNMAKSKVAWITPVPGGVGPMTVASLLQNTLAACEGQEAHV